MVEIRNRKKGRMEEKHENIHETEKLEDSDRERERQRAWKWKTRPTYTVCMLYTKNMAVTLTGKVWVCLRKIVCGGKKRKFSCSDVSDGASARCTLSSSNF